jgi:hypothetical protein
LLHAVNTTANNGEELRTKGAEGIPFRPYKDMHFRIKIIKADGGRNAATVWQ